MNLKSSVKLKLTFYGGARSVTGSNFMLSKVRPLTMEGRTFSILVDCGLHQGKDFCEDKSCQESARPPARQSHSGGEGHPPGRKSIRTGSDGFAYNPAEVKTLLVTHAHADHIGRVPKLVHDGFKGEIISTQETKEIAEIMLDDSLKFVLKEAMEAKREPIYSKDDISKTMSLWKDIPYHKSLDVGGGFSVYFKDAGHILGSAIIEINFNGKKIAFTGDLGNSPTPFLRDTEAVTDADYLLIESVYGDRNHEDVELRKEKLKSVVERIIKNKGTLLIPAFSVSRTQILLYELNDLIENKKLPEGFKEIPVFLDSPLGIKVTEIYRKRQQNFKEEAKKQIARGDKIFDFPKLKLTPSVEDSKAINSVPGPKIIIAGSGMSTGGRILHHEKRYLPDPNNIILFVGYQAPGSLGRIIQDGTREVEIDETKISVKAKIETITGYSGHMDSNGLLEFIERAGESTKLKKVFVAMGEPKSSMFLVQRIKDYLDIDAVTPEEGESFELEF